MKDRIARTLLAGLAAAGSLAPAAEAARGGPDAGGYRWIDRYEPGYGPLQVDQSSSTLFATLGDETIQMVNLPWNFTFYGVTTNRVWVSSNGWLAFTDPGGNAAPANAPLPAAAAPNHLLAFAWDDLVVDNNNSSYGPGVDGSFVIFIWANEKLNPGELVIAKIMIYPTGVIKLYWGSTGIAATKAVGIENAGGTIGSQVWRNGVGTNNANLQSDYAVTFHPPASLNCTTPAPTPLSCGQRLNGQTNAGGPSQVAAYGCAPGTQLGPEKTFSFSLARTSNVTVRLINAPAGLRANLIAPGCHEAIDCLAGGAQTITRNFVPPGGYTIVVDGVLATDAGGFDIELSCTDSATQAPCDGPVLSGNIAAGAPSLMTAWQGCLGIPMGGSPGGERVYEVTLPASGSNLVADIVSGPSNLRIYIVSAASFDPSAPGCLATGTSHAAVYNQPGSATYFVIVDDDTGAGGAFELRIGCSGKLACSGAAVIDVANPAPIAGTTLGQPNNVDWYWCSNASLDGAAELGVYDGGEAVYSFTVPAGMVVGFYFTSPNPNLRPFILTGCNEGLCYNQANCVESVASGDYLLVIDGINGARDNFQIAPFVVAAPPAGLQRWNDCMECIGSECPGTQVDQTEGTVWHFSSMNYCGWGCTWAMYAVVECGTELHLPMWDVETGDIKIWDVLRSRYVDLTGTGPVQPGCPWPQNAVTEVQWTDRGCSQSPCRQPPTSCDVCGGGGDPCSTDTVIDVSFQGTPAACGVYRIEFLNMGGCVWDLFANCDGSNTERYPIYTDICSAVSDFRPYPDLVLSNVRIDNSPCASLQANVIVDVTNQGCLPAAAVPITISDGTTTQTFNMGDVLAGRVVSRTFTFGPLAATPSTLTVTVDPGTPGQVLECREVTNARACGSTTGQRQLTAQACPNTCSTTAEAGPTDIVVCEGTDLPVSGSGTTANCLASGPLEYQWKVDGNVVAGCAFSTNPDCTIPGSLLLAGIPHIVTLEVQCAGAPAQCPSSDSIVVNANADVPPPVVGNTLRGIRSAAQRNDASWSWSSVVDPGLSGYRMWKHTAKADLPLRANRTAIGTTTSTTTTLNEPNAVPPPPPLAFYQVVGLSCSGLNESPY